MGHLLRRTTKTKIRLISTADKRRGMALSARLRPTKALGQTEKLRTIDTQVADHLGERDHQTADLGNLRMA